MNDVVRCAMAMKIICPTDNFTINTKWLIDKMYECTTIKCKIDNNYKL